MAGILAGEPRWLSTTLLILQNNTAGGLYTYDTGTLALTAVDALGENRLGAGAGVYAAYLAGGGTPGVRTNIAGFGNLPFAAIGDVTETGQVVVVPDAANYQGVSVFDATGTGLWSLSVGLAGGTSPHARVNYTTYADVVSSTWHVWQNAPPLQQSFTAPSGFPVVWTVPCVVNGAVYVLEQSDRLTFRQKDATQGYVITTGVSFNPDVRLLSPGVVRIGWCVNAGESTDSLRLMDLVVATGVNQVGAPSAGVIVFVPGTTLTATAIPGNPTDVGGALGTLGGLYPPLRQPVQERNNLISKPWARWATDVGTTLQSVARTTGGPVATPPATPSTANVVGPAASVDGEIVLYSGVTGKVLKRATGTGPVQATAGVYSVATDGVVLHKVTVALNDGDIQALPSTPFPLVPAPGAGLILIPIMIVMRVGITVAYTNIDATLSYIFVTQGGNAIGNYIADDPTTTPVLTGVTDLLVTNPDSTVYLVPFSQTTAPESLEWGNVAYVEPINTDNLALGLQMTNAAGPLGGGDAANVMQLQILYVVSPV